MVRFGEKDGAMLRLFILYQSGYLPTHKLSK